jgi:hypothetical protein
MVSRFAYAAGVTGTLANLFLLAFFAFRFGGIGGASFGPVNDLVGSLATTFMVPVALAVLTVGGPLLVLGMLSFEVQAPIVTAAWLILFLWLFLVNRWLRSSGVLASRLAWFGEFVSAGTAAGIAIFGLGVLMPGMSRAQLILFGFGGVIAVIGMLGIPVWFVLLGRHLSRA